MTNKLKLFKERLNKKLVVEKIQEIDDGKNKILEITFGSVQRNFMIIRQENVDKMCRAFFENKNDDKGLKTNSSCDFIIIMSSKNTIEIAFVECKSNVNDYTDAVHQINFSILWFKYLAECYCYCFNVDNKEWEDIIVRAKKYLIYPSINATKIKLPTSNDKNDIDNAIKNCKKLGIIPLSQQLLLHKKKIHINNPIKVFFY